MKLGRKEQKILLYAGGVLLVALTWVFIFQKGQERNMALAQENMELEEQVNLLRTLAANEKRYKKEIKQMKKEISEIYQCFPAEIKEETVIMYGCGLEDKTMVHIDNIKIASKNLAFGTEPEAQETTGETEKTEETEKGKEETEKDIEEVYLYNTNVDYGFFVTYAGIKDTIDYIFQDKEKRTVRSLALAYDEETGNLQGILNVDFYGLEGTKASYEEPWVPSMPLGEKNVFGTVEHMGDKKP